jgi:dihydroorotate dehydrogenase electron transfer subunit
MTPASPSSREEAAAIPARSQFRSVVVANTPLCREHYRLVVRLPTFPATDPGQFVQIACRDLAHEQDDATLLEREVEWMADRPPRLDAPEIAGPLAFLRRPFSLAGRRDTSDGVELEVIHRVVGVGTDWLARLRPGDTVDVLGPLGNRFALPPSGATTVMVGGGVGIPPMIYLAERLVGRAAVAFAGALTRDLLPLQLTGEADPTGEPRAVVGEFARHGIPSVITTDDGTYGFRGFVTQALERYLDRHHSQASSAPPPVVYTCGPEPMMKRVAEIASTRGLECQVAVERAMACGMGTCQSCCIRVRKPDPSQPPLVGRDWCYRLACTDGPVFRGADLLW